MDSKRKHTATRDDDYTKSKSKKSNIPVYTQGRSSADLTDSVWDPLPAIALNITNLQEQNTGTGVRRFDDFKTYLNGPIRSTVITSGSPQNNGHGYYWTRDEDQMSASHRSQLSTCNKLINRSIACNCDSREYYFNDGLHSAASSGTTEQIDLFQSSDEINTTIADESMSSTITSVSQQYNWYQGDRQMNDVRSKLPTCSGLINGNACNCDLREYYSNDKLRTADSFGTTKHTNLFQCSDDDISTITSSECSDELITSSEIISVGQQDKGNNYYRTKTYVEMNDTRPKLFTASNNNMTNVDAYNNCGDPSECPDDGVQTIDCSSISKRTNTTSTLQCRDDGNINTASTSESSMGSTILTSVRKHGNRCLIYLTEYDAAMNETRLEIYNIVKPIITSMEKPTGPFIVTSSGCDTNGYNGERTQQPSTSLGHDNDPEALRYRVMKDNTLPNNAPGDDEVGPKTYTEL